MYMYVCVHVCVRVSVCVCVCNSLYKTRRARPTHTTQLRIYPCRPPTPRGHRIQYRGAKAEQLRGALRKGLRSGGKRGRRVDQNRGHVNGRVELTHVRGAG